MLGFQKDANDGSHYKKIGWLTVRSIPFNNDEKKFGSKFPFLLGFELDAFKKYLPTKVIAKIVSPFEKITFKMNKNAAILTMIFLSCFVAFFLISNAGNKPSDLSLLFRQPIAFYVAVILGLVLHEAAHAAVADKIYRKDYGKEAIDSVGLMVMPLFIAVAALVWLVSETGLVSATGIAFMNFIALFVFGGAYVRLVGEKTLYEQLDSHKKIAVFVAGIAMNLILALAATVFLLLEVFVLHTGNYFLLDLGFYTIIINVTLAVFNLVPMGLPTDGGQIWKEFEKTTPHIKSYSHVFAVFMGIIFLVFTVTSIRWW
jgi:Zn-dependent protease